MTCFAGGSQPVTDAIAETVGNGTYEGDYPEFNQHNDGETSSTADAPSADSGVFVEVMVGVLCAVGIVSMITMAVCIKRSSGGDKPDVEAAQHVPELSPTDCVEVVEAETTADAGNTESV